MLVTVYEVNLYSDDKNKVRKRKVYIEGPIDLSLSGTTMVIIDKGQFSKPEAIFRISVDCVALNMTDDVIRLLTNKQRHDRSNNQRMPFQTSLCIHKGFCLESLDLLENVLCI